MKADTRLSPGQMILKMMHKSRFLSVSGKADWLLYLMFTSKLEICHSNLKNNFDINDDFPSDLLASLACGEGQTRSLRVSDFQTFSLTDSCAVKKVRKGPFNVIYVNSETGHKLNKMTKKLV